MKQFFFCLLFIATQFCSAQVLQTTPFVNNDVNGVLGFSNWIYIYGSFSQIGGHTISSLARLDATTGDLDSTWNPAPDHVNAMIIQNGQLVVGGDFTTIAGQSRQYVALFDAATGNLSPIAPNVPVTISTLCGDGLNLVYFNSYDSVITLSDNSRVQRFNQNTGIIDSWQTSLIQSNADPFGIMSLAVLDSFLYVGGTFVTVDQDTMHQGLARFSVQSGLVDPSWTYHIPSINSGSLWVRNMLNYNNNLYIVGSFDQLSGLPQDGNAEFAPDGSLLSYQVQTLGIGNQLYALYPQGSTLWIGGNQAYYGGLNNRMAQVSIITAQATCWDGFAMNLPSVNAIYVAGDTVYVAGSSACCSSSSLLKFVGSPAPYVPVITGVDSITTQFTYTYSTAPVSGIYIWQVFGGTGSSLTDTISVTWTRPGIDTLLLIEVPPSGCQRDTSIFLVYMPCPDVTLNFGINSNRNGDGFYWFTDSSSGANSDGFEWTIDGVVQPGFMWGYLDHNFAPYASYQVCEYNTVSPGCTYSYCQTFTPCPPVHAHFYITATDGRTVTLADSSWGTDGNQTLLWYINSDTVSLIGETITLTFPIGETWVCLQVLDGGCGFGGYSQDCQWITVCPQLYFEAVDNGCGNYTFIDLSTTTDGNQMYYWGSFPLDGSGGELISEDSTFGYALTQSTVICENISDNNANCPAETGTGYCDTIIYNSITAYFTTVNDSNGNFTFTDSSLGTDGNQGIYWSVNGTLIASGSVFLYTFTPGNIYTICESIQDLGCSSSSCIQIPFCPFVAVAFDTITNGDGTITFTDSSTGKYPNATYSWFFADSVHSTDSFFNYTFEPGFYHVCEYVSENECHFPNFCMDIRICPTISLFFDTLSNDGNYVLMDWANGGDGYQTYQWSINGINIGTDSVLYYPLSSGVYQFCGLVIDSGCIFNQCKNITICQPVQVMFDTVDNGLGVYTFSDASVGGDSNTVYSWFADGLFIDSGNLILDSLSPGKHQICESVSDNGCSYNNYCDSINTCPQISAYFNSSNLGNGNYIFIDSSIGRFGTVAINWKVDGSVVGVGDTITYLFSQYGVFLVCEDVTDGASCSTNQFCQQINFSPGTGVKSLTLGKNRLEVFPNPSSEYANILYQLNDWNGSNFTLEILNNMGQRIFTQQLPKSFGLQRVNLSDLPGGLYIISIRNENAIIVSAAFSKQ